MKNWTYDELIKQGYEITNALITLADLIMIDHDVMTLELALESESWYTVYGGYVLGHGYLGCDDAFIDGSAIGMESLIRIMITLGADRFQKLEGRRIRVASKGQSKIIGNIEKDQWFDIDSFFTDGETCQ